MDEWIVIPSWPKWQSRRDRRDPWIKDWLDQDDREEYRNLTLAEVGLLTVLRRLYARSDGVVSTVSARRLIGRETRQKQWDSLVDAGLLVISAAKPPRISSESAARAPVEVEVEVETPQTPLKKGNRKKTGYRFVRGSHGSSYVRDPNGTDRLPNGWQG